GVYLGCASALIVLACARAERPPPRMLLLAGFAAGLGAWTKNEGALYTAGLLLLGFKLFYAPANDLARLSTSAGLIAHALDPLRWGELLLYSLRRVVF